MTVLPPNLPHPFSPRGRQDPHASWAWLRTHEPVHHDATSGLWLVTTYAGCTAVLRDPAFSAALGQRERARDDDLPASMLTTDGVDHRRLRAPGGLLLGPAALRSITPALHGRIEALLRHVLGHDDAHSVDLDVTDDLGTPVATAAFATLLDLAEDDLPVFQGLARRASVNLDPLVGASVAAAGRSAAQWLTRWAGAHADRLLATGSTSPFATLLREGGLSRAETVAVVDLAVIGGWQPLAAMVANALHWAAVHPEDVPAMLAADPVRLVDELVRLEAPVPFTVRVAREAVDIPGGHVPAGARVLAVLAAAGRDPAVAAEPDRFLPDRAGVPSPAFGAGPHFCLGAGLVREVGAQVLPTLLGALRPVHAEVAGWRPALVPRHVAPMRLSFGVPAGAASRPGSGEVRPGG